MNLIRAKAVVFLVIVLILELSGCSYSEWKSAQPPIPFPATRQENAKDTLHGIEIADPYRWLEDQQSPETRQWIETQNRYTRAMIGQYEGREAIKKRLGELMRVDSIGLPVERAGRYFFMKKLADQDLNVIYMRRGLTGKDEILVDPHPLSPDRSTSVGIMDISDDGTLLAYSLRQGGKDEVAVKLLNVDTGETLSDSMPPGRYFGVSITQDKHSIYYSRHDESGSRIYVHAIGDDPANDKKIFGDGYGPGQLVSAFVSDNGKHLIIVVNHGSAAKKTEVYAKNLSVNGSIVNIVNDLDARFEPEVGGDTLYLQTNLDAPNGRVLAVDLNFPIPDNRLARETWREVIPEAPDAIESVLAIGGRLVVQYLHNAQTDLKIYDADGKLAAQQIKSEPMGSVGGIVGRWDSPEMFYSYSNFFTPTTLHRAELNSDANSVWSKIEVPFDSDSYESKQVWVASKDGTKLPMFVTHKKGMKLDGSAPTLLTAYGGFNISLTPGFSARTALWIERGGVWAVPNLRGGGEFGEKWHEAGMLANKQNVFDDFLASAQWLIENRYTSSERLAISGGSNGGLLVGAAITQRPELFRAAICGYPLLDMVRYHQFLVARFWVPEYGSSEDATQFKTLFAYSPYHHVKPGVKYPSTFFVTGDSDTRVDPLHARKMTALLQASTASANERPIMIHYDVKAGHSGGKPVSKQIEDTADELAFLAWQLGMD